MRTKLRVGDRLLLADGWDENNNENPYIPVTIVSFNGPASWPTVRLRRPLRNPGYPEEFTIGRYAAENGRRAYQVRHTYLQDDPHENRTTAN